MFRLLNIKSISGFNYFPKKPLYATEFEFNVVVKLSIKSSSILCTLRTFSIEIRMRHEVLYWLSWRQFRRGLRWMWQYRSFI